MSEIVLSFCPVFVPCVALYHNNISMFEVFVPCFAGQIPSFCRLIQKNSHVLPSQQLLQLLLQAQNAIEADGPIESGDAVSKILATDSCRWEMQYLWILRHIKWKQYV